MNFNLTKDDKKKTIITCHKRKYVIDWFDNQLSKISDYPNGRTKWFKAGRRGPTGIGYTLESAFGKPEDNLQQPDLAPKGLNKCIELKAHDMLSSSPVTIFTKSPGAPRGANSIIRNNFGYVTDKSKGQKICMTSVFEHGEFNSKSNHYFKAINDKKNKKVIVAIGSKDHLKNIASWSYERLDKALSSKVKILAVVKAERKTDNKGIRYYRYLPHAVIMTHFDLQDLLKALDNNDAFVDLRIGVYLSGKNKGKTHDHGTGFRMTLPNLIKYANLSGNVIEK